jgi:2-dehydropantoate 2-reductase
MRIGVIGAGAIGGAMAALASAAGHDVEVTARGAHLAAIRTGGIRLTGGWGDLTAEVEAGETLTRAPELAIVATKALDARAAILGNARLLNGVPVVVVQNGLKSISATKPLLPRSDVLGGLALYATSLVEPGHIAITTPGPTFLGGGAELPSRYVVSVLDPIMPTRLIDNFLGAQWTKLVVNQVNALPAITGMSVQEVVANPALRRILTLSMRENVSVARKSRIRFGSLQGLSDGRLRLFASVPLGLADSLPKLMARRMGDTPNPGSTLQSIRRGTRTEIDYLNGAVVDAARAIGADAPVNAALVALVHEVEDTHRYLTPAELKSRLKTP